MNEQERRRAFVAVEVAAILAVLGALAVFLAVGTGETRRRAHIAGSVSNLQQFGAGASAFAADNADRIVSFSWHRGEAHSDPDGYSYPPAPSDVQAGTDQAVSIIRRMGHRPDLLRTTSWFAHPLNNHLALVEYLGRALPAEFVVSPSDHNRLAWQRAGRVNDQGAAYFALTNRPSGSDNVSNRWPYNSSYEFGPCFYSPDRMVNGVLTVSQGQTHRVYYFGADTVLGRRTFSEVVYPANKAMVYETLTGDGEGRRCFFAYDQVRTPILFADGSLAVRLMRDANRGFDPNSPDSPLPTRIGYSPEPSWEPPPLSGGAVQFIIGRVRWTRAGLRGLDFGGPEVVPQ